MAGKTPPSKCNVKEWLPLPSDPHLCEKCEVGPVLSTISHLYPGCWLNHLPGLYAFSMANVDCMHVCYSRRVRRRQRQQRRNLLSPRKFLRHRNSRLLPHLPRLHRQSQSTMYANTSAMPSPSSFAAPQKMIVAIRDHDPDTALLVLEQGLSADVELHHRETASSANLASGATLLHYAVISKALKIMQVTPTTVQPSSADLLIPCPRCIASRFFWRTVLMSMLPTPVDTQVCTSLRRRMESTPPK